MDGRANGMTTSPGFDKQKTSILPNRKDNIAEAVAAGQPPLASRGNHKGGKSGSQVKKGAHSRPRDDQGSEMSFNPDK